MLKNKVPLSPVRMKAVIEVNQSIAGNLLQLRGKRFLHVFYPTARRYGTEMSSVDEVEFAVVPMLSEIIRKLVVVDTALSVDAIEESLHLIIDSRSDIEPAPIIECVDIKVSTLMI